MKSLTARLNESIINESVQNFQDQDLTSKRKWMYQVWDILQSSYASQGGIHGSGFGSPNDMLRIPMWKLDIVDGQVLCVVMYKFKKEAPDDIEFRKMVACGIARDPELLDQARLKFQNIMKSEFERSILEVSGNMLVYLKKRFPTLVKQYQLTTEEAQSILSNRKLKKVTATEYQREIGGQLHTKTMLGRKIQKY